MIRPSPEIEAVVRRFTSAIRNHEVADLPHYLSRNDALLYVGTAEGEVWQGSIVRDGISDHLAEVPDFRETDVEISAYENGDTGWAFYTSHFHFPRTGSRGTHRVTFVFVMERGSWKMVQHHISQADSNIDKIGIEHEAFRALIEAARKDFRLDQRTGHATVMFTDIADSTPLAARLGDRAWAAAVSRHFASIRAQVTARDGQFVKSLGDGTMSMFRSARAAMDAARDIQATLASQSRDPRLQVRIGLHTGDVVQTEGDFFGTVVNKAARIAATARPGEILVSDATCTMLGSTPEFRFADPATVPLKGLEGDHMVYRLEWRA